MNVNANGCVAVPLEEGVAVLLEVTTLLELAVAVPVWLDKAVCAELKELEPVLLEDDELVPVLLEDGEVVWLEAAEPLELDEDVPLWLEDSEKLALADGVAVREMETREGDGRTVRAGVADALDVDGAVGIAVAVVVALDEAVVVIVSEVVAVIAVVVLGERVGVGVSVGDADGVAVLLEVCVSSDVTVAVIDGVLGCDALLVCVRALEFVPVGVMLPGARHTRTLSTSKRELLTEAIAVVGDAEDERVLTAPRQVDVNRHPWR